MLWRKKKSPEGASEGSSAGDDAASEPSEKALDVVTILVRLYGKHAFDIDTADARAIETRCDEWATRISVGAPRPSRASGNEPRVEANKGRPEARGAFRDWPGLISFIRDQRRAESEYVVRSLGDFREAVLCFAECLTKTVSEERATDSRVGEQLDTLSQAISTRDTARICAEAERVVDAVRHSIAERRKREAEQVWALGERMRALREELSDARKKAQIDALTQLSNRAAFDAHLVHLGSLGVLLGEAPWLMLADLDHFKAINDNYGHPTGDEVLRQVSQCLSRTFLRKQDFVCRYGGEEFAAVLLDTTSAQMIMLTERLLASVRGLTVVHGPHEVNVTLSVGLAAFAPGESLTSWLARADAALYCAKREGRDTFRLALEVTSEPKTAG